VAALADAAATVLTLDMAASQAGRASAFFVAPDAGGEARLVTCRHAVVGRGMLLGLPLADGTRLDAGLAAQDAGRDLAVLSADGTAPAVLALADRQPAADDRVWAVTRFGVAEGRFVGPHADPEAGPTILISVSGLRPGASGGAVVDADGRVLGVVRGAVEDDPERVVVIPAAAAQEVLAGETTR
jgi:S1-C subfamily serine protease